MIATKQKKSFVCTKCSHSQAKWTGQCMSCKSWNCMDEVAIEPKKYTIPKISEKRKLEVELNKCQKSDLDKWYDFVRDYELANGDCLCMNCGKPIRHQLLSKDTWVWRGTICHVIAKSKFPSVATNIHNYLIMDLQCHSDYDSSFSKAITLPVFNIAKNRFKMLKNAIKESTTKLPKELTD